DTAAGMPGMAMDGIGTGRMASAPAWSLGAWTPIIAMWWTMMIAMMSPSAAPTILIYARVHLAPIRRAIGRRPSWRGRRRAGRGTCRRSQWKDREGCDVRLRQPRVAAAGLAQ